MGLKFNMRMNLIIDQYSWCIGYGLLRSSCQIEQLKSKQIAQMSLGMSFGFMIFSMILQENQLRHSLQSRIRLVVKKKGYVPVPYNMTIQLSIMTELNDDMRYRTDSSIFPTIMISQSTSQVTSKRRRYSHSTEVSLEDDYEGNFETRSSRIFLTFTNKTFCLVLCPMYQVILSRRLLLVMLGSAGPGSQKSERDLIQSCTKGFIQDYDDSYVTTIARMQIQQKLLSGGHLNSQLLYIQIGKEEMYIEKVSGNKLTVRESKINRQ